MPGVGNNREKFQLFGLTWVHLYSKKLNTTLCFQMTGTDTEFLSLRQMTRLAGQERTDALGDFNE